MPIATTRPRNAISTPILSALALTLTLAPAANAQQQRLSTPSNAKPAPSTPPNPTQPPNQTTTPNKNNTIIIGSTKPYIPFALPNINISKNKSANTISTDFGVITTDASAWGWGWYAGDWSANSYRYRYPSGWGYYDYRFNDPYVAYYGTSGTVFVGPIYDLPRIQYPTVDLNLNQQAAPPPEPTPEQRLAKAFRDRDYADAQTLARQQANYRIEALALIARGQAEQGVQRFATAYRDNPSNFDNPIDDDAYFNERNHIRRVLGIAVRHAHKDKTAEAWFTVAEIMRAESRLNIADQMLERAKQAQTEGRGKLPTPPPPTTPPPTPTTNQSQTTPPPATPTPTPPTPSSPPPPTNPPQQP